MVSLSGNQPSCFTANLSCCDPPPPPPVFGFTPEAGLAGAGMEDEVGRDAAAFPSAPASPRLSCSLLIESPTPVSLSGRELLALPVRWYPCSPTPCLGTGPGISNKQIIIYQPSPFIYHTAEISNPLYFFSSLANTMSPSLMYSVSSGSIS